ncbi:Cof-type HAD-IIB family hydrolase [Clostridium weizhouense]|uniref:Cof-type HAD-IIB family hydrolase n=1 Tax=Clostridium weizhouense TaxID=2859781 RepID=A0ABS7ANM4_9CLOT|nr:HAD family hydrolase [Clostridium weizhouense]MBW6410271.1 Cof-type HAD-IIB family hydrolase [Clostridium weizhouense]
MFFFDIDGTIKPYNRNISISTRNTIKRLKELGNIIFLATGRRYNEIKFLMKELDIENAVCAGGATVVINNNIEKEEFFAKDKLKNILYECKKYNIIIVSVSNEKCYTTYKGIKLLPYIFLMKILSKTRFFKIGSVNGIALNSYMNIKVVDEKTFLEKSTQKLIFYNYRHIKKVQSIKEYTIYNNVFCSSVEFEFKEKGIEYIRNKYNVHLDNIVVFGDGLNDISMFEYAKNTIAMGNACEEIKQRASFITKKSNKDGIEYACKYFNWI